LVGAVVLVWSVVLIRMVIGSDGPEFQHCEWFALRDSGYGPYRGSLRHLVE